MNLKELPFPIRIYWDLTPPPGEARVDYSEICDQVAEAKFFTLSLLDSGRTLSDPCMKILERLKDEPIVISLTASHHALNPPTLQRLSALNVRELLIDVSSSDDLRLIGGSIKDFHELPMKIGASVQVTEASYRDIPDVVSYCLEQGIERLVFPMQRLSGKNTCFYVSKDEGGKLSHRLSALKIENLKITIHDPFLWKIFYPAVSFPGGGCQAGNSMAYIAPDGKVLPCPSMPIVLGDLSVTPLKAILSSASKKALVKTLREAPEECTQCNDLTGCLGGCSGRVFKLTASLTKRDPACG